MHKLTSNPALDKALALGILAILIGIAYALFTQVYLQGLMQLDDEIDSERTRAGRVDAILAKQQYFDSKITQARNKVNRNRLFLASTDAAGASSEIQNTLKNLISKNSGARILTIKPYPAVKHEGYSEVSLEIVMKDISHAELQKTLFGIENNSPLLIIKELDVNQTRLSYKSLVAQLGSSSDLNGSLVVSGFFKEKAQ